MEDSSDAVLDTRGSLPDAPLDTMENSADARFDWFRERLTCLMGVDDEQYAATVIVENRDALAAFFDDPIESYGDVCKQVIFFWRTWYDRLVEETVTVLEEGQLIENVLPLNCLHFCLNYYNYSATCYTGRGAEERKEKR